MFSGLYHAVAEAVPGFMGYDLSGLWNSLPLPIVIIAGLVFLVAFFGFGTRFKAILAGKGTGTDFIGLIIIAVILALLVYVLKSGVVSGMRLM